MRTLVDPKELAELKADAARVSFLEHLNARKVNGGMVICRDSLSGRGWRLHETGLPEAAAVLYKAVPKGTVREAIDDAMRRANLYGTNMLKGDQS